MEESPEDQKRPQLSHTELREKLSNLQIDQVDKEGNTLLHRLVDSSASQPINQLTPIYIFIECGLPINHPNKAGQTALHNAVRSNRHLVVEALLQCGADPNVADKMGVTPAGMCSSVEMRDTMARYQPGLLQAVTSGDFGAVCKLMKNWVSVTSKSLDNGQSMLNLAKGAASQDVYVLRCMEKIRDSQAQVMLVHAVLADNVKKARDILENTKMRTVNCRYKRERSLLSIALENKNCEMVELMLQHGVKTNGRVRHRLLPQTDVVPCVLLAYSCQPHVQVAQLLWTYGIHALHERDTEGNTSLIRAVKHGASLSFIEWYVNTTQGETIAKRNAERLTAYEVASSCNRQDVITFINQYIEDNLERLSVSLMVQFYGSLHPKLSGIYQKVEVNGIELFKAACCNDLKTVICYNLFNYQDRNGYTALHKAVASSNMPVVKEIGHTRPVLKGMADNHGRYPLHIAFLLPDNKNRQEILDLLLQSDPERYEYVTDMNGRNPADYLHIDEDLKQSILSEITGAAY